MEGLKNTVSLSPAYRSLPRKSSASRDGNDTAIQVFVSLKSRESPSMTNPVVGLKGDYGFLEKSFSIYDGAQSARFHHLIAESFAKKTVLDVLLRMHKL